MVDGREILPLSQAEVLILEEHLLPVGAANGHKLLRANEEAKIAAGKHISTLQHHISSLRKETKA
jgi:hypothetical protein